MGERVNLTEDRIRAARAPAHGEYVMWDTKVTGLHVRVFSSGRKMFSVVYRAAGSGRNGKKKRITLKPVGDISLADARAAAQGYLGQVAAGRDPAAERKQIAQRKAARLDRALDAYGKHLERRHVVHAQQIVRLLKRYMPGPLDQVDLADIDRQKIAACIARIEKQQGVATTEQRKRKRDPQSGQVEVRVATVRRKVGGVGAAADFRTKAHTFFSWAASQGLIYANPLAGWRRERTTRAQMVDRSGKALSPQEIVAVWNACGEVAAPYGDYVKLLLLTGQRRTETAKMRRPDVDLAAGAWVIPADVAKNGREHFVPLPEAAIAILTRQQRRDSNPYMFAGANAGTHMSNFSKRQADLVRRSGVSFGLHDLRRTFRSGLRRLGVETELSELMLNHVRSELVEIYDREPRADERRRAAKLWAEYLEGLVPKNIEGAGKPVNVVPLRSASRT